VLIRVHWIRPLFTKRVRLFLNIWICFESTLTRSLGTILLVSQQAYTNVNTFNYSLNIFWTGLIQLYTEYVQKWTAVLVPWIFPLAQGTCEKCGNVFGLRFFPKIFPSGSIDSYNILFFHASGEKCIILYRLKSQISKSIPALPWQQIIGYM